MKAIVINASPRKNWNTAELIKSAKKGAESAGAETEYFDLYDLSFRGCMSCLACKRKGNEPCRCYWNDDLPPLIEKILNANTLLIGSPIYFGEPTAQFRALLERLLFCVLSYDTRSSAFKGKLNIGLIYTMNAPRETYENIYLEKFKFHEHSLVRLLNGEVRSLASCDTLQVPDYSKYNMTAFSEEHKRKVHDEVFPQDLQNAYKLGAELSRI
jgi:multimeric flavodoxin WrbA